MKDSGLIKMILDFENDHEDIINEWREEIGIIDIEEKIQKVLLLAREQMKNEQENYLPLIKFIWIVIHYSKKDHILLKSYLNKIIDNPSEKPNNAIKSLETVYDHLLNEDRINSNTIRDLKIENIITNDFGKAFKINKMLIKEVKTKIRIKEKSRENQVVITQNNKLTLKQIALKHFYEGNLITRDNANCIAKDYGYKSGEKLYQHYTHYSQKENRTKFEHESKRAQKSQIHLFESVKQYINDKKQIEDLMNDTSILKANFQKY